MSRTESRAVVSHPFSQPALFGGRYDVEVSPYSGPHVSQRCFMFCGQSSIFPGMFAKEARELESFRVRLKEADELLEQMGLPKCSRYLLNPESLTAVEKHQLRNPALFTSQVALFEHLEHLSVRPNLITSHSFGEYAGLFASGIARFQDLLKIVVMRDQLSPEPASLGVMIAVNADQEKISKALEIGSYCVTCINSPKQTTIAVRSGQVAPTIARLKKAHLPALALTEIPQPYHTPWMKEVSDRLREAIIAENFIFSSPTIPFLSSVDRSVLEAESFSPSHVVQLMSRQLVEPVDFVEQITRVGHRRIYHFLEIGPSASCSQFVSDTIKHPVLKISHLSRYLDRDVKIVKKTFLAAEQGKLSSLLNDIICSITGYNIDEISVQDKFQEDLGIDSIKKAEIVFKMTEALNGSEDTFLNESVNLSKLTQIGDILDLVKKAQESKKPAAAKITDFKLYSAYLKKAVINDLELSAVSNDEMFLTFDLEKPSTWDLSAITKNSTLLFVARKSAVAKPTIEAYKDDVEPVLQVLLRLAMHGDLPAYKVAVVLEDGCRPFLRSLDGLFKSWVKEYTFAELKVFSFQSIPSDSRLSEIIREEFGQHTDYDLRFEGETRFVKRFAELPQGTSKSFSEAPVLVSVGGATGIGTAVLAEAMQRFPKGRFFVLGRRGEDDANVQTSLAKLRRENIELTYLSADASSESSLTSAFTLIHERCGRVDLVLNSAGMQVSRSIAGKPLEEFQQEFESKFLPAQNLLKLCEKFNVPRLINYSSVSATFGNIGQTGYAFANRAVQELSQSESSRLEVRTLILPAWNNLGMTEDKMILSRLRASQASLLPPEVGGRLVMESAVSDDFPSTVFFMDANDLQSFEVGLYGRRYSQALVERPYIRPSRMKISNLNTSVNPSFLEHKVLGKCVFPASSAAALFYAVAEQFLRAAPDLHNFKAHSFLPLNFAPSVHYFDFKVSSDATLGLELSSEIVNFSAEAKLGTEPEAFNPEPFKKFKRADSLLSLDPSLIDLGPVYRNLGETWLGENGDVCGYQSTKKFQFGAERHQMEVISQMIECALQVLGAKLLEDEHKFWVPNVLEQVHFRFDWPLTETITYRIRVDKIEGDHAVGSCYAFNENGDSLLVIKNADMYAVGTSHRGLVFYP